MVVRHPGLRVVAYRPALTGSFKFTSDSELPCQGPANRLGTVAGVQCGTVGSSRGRGESHVRKLESAASFLSRPRAFRLLERSGMSDVSLRRKKLEVICKVKKACAWTSLFTETADSTGFKF